MRAVLFLIFFTWASTSADLASDFQEFVDLIPLDEINSTALRYAGADLEYQAALTYILSPEWASIYQGLKQSNEAQILYAYILEAGLDLQVFEKFFQDVLGVQEGVGIPISSSFWNDVFALIPKAKFVVLINIKFITSPDFAQFFGSVSSEDARRLVEELRSSPEYSMVDTIFANMGLDLTPYWYTLYSFLGWN